MFTLSKTNVRSKILRAKALTTKPDYEAAVTAQT